MSVLRILNVALLLALGASLAVNVSHLRSHAAPAKANEIVAPTPVPPPPPPPSPSDPNMRPMGAYQPTIQSCYERVRRKNPHIHEQLDLRLTIGISGRVKHVGVAQPNPKLQPLVDCVREVAARWAFPPNGVEYSVEIPASPWPTRPFEPEPPSSMGCFRQRK